MSTKVFLAVAAIVLALLSAQCARSSMAWLQEDEARCKAMGGEWENASRGPTSCWSADGRNLFKVRK